MEVLRRCETLLSGCDEFVDRLEQPRIAGSGSAHGLCFQEEFVGQDGGPSLQLARPADDRTDMGTVILWAGKTRSLIHTSLSTPRRQGPVPSRALYGRGNR